MTRDETIDFLHAMWQQLGTKSVSLDGIETSVGSICLNAIDIIENEEINTISPLANFEQQVNTSLFIQDELSKWRKERDEE